MSLEQKKQTSMDVGGNQAKPKLPRILFFHSISAVVKYDPTKDRSSLILFILLFLFQLVFPFFPPFGFPLVLSSSLLRCLVAKFNINPRQSASSGLTLSDECINKNISMKFTDQEGDIDQSSTTTFYSIKTSSNSLMTYCH